MRVAVVGGGFVGRLAAWAVMQSGDAPTIIDKTASPFAPRGFVFLHQRCNLPLDEHVIRIGAQGDAQEYARKVYADPDYKTSFGLYNGLRVGYSPAEALRTLVDLQEGMVQVRNVGLWDEVLRLRDEYDRVIFTLPARNFLQGGWFFNNGWVDVEAADPRRPNYCVYNSNPEIPWHRAGTMFGTHFKEFATYMADCQLIKKVIPIDRGLPQYDNVLLTGRFATWSKQLVHESYEEVLRWLNPPTPSI
jgi:hypothetical protein